MQYNSPLRRPSWGERKPGLGPGPFYDFTPFGLANGIEPDDPHTQTSRKPYQTEKPWNTRRNVTVGKGVLN